MHITDIIKQDLRGHDYLQARGLAKRISFKGEQASHRDCAVCAQAEKLPAVLNILASIEMPKTVRRVR